MGASSSVNKAKETHQEELKGGGGGVKRVSRGRDFSIDDVFQKTFGDYVIDSNSLRYSELDSTLSPTSKKNFIPKTAPTRALIQAGLQGNFIFDSLTQQQLDRIIDAFKPITCEAGETIIQQGASGGSDHMYVIENGSFEVQKKGQGIISTCHTGDTFGELSLLYGAKRSSTVTCTKKANLWALDRQTFRYYQALSDKKLSEFTCSVLEKVYSFKALQKQQMEKAAEVARPVEYQEGDIICRNGEMGSDFYIVLDGVVNCSKDSMKEGRDILMKTIPSENSSEISDQGKEEEKEESKEEGRDAKLTSAVLPPGGFRLKAGDWFGEESFVQHPYVCNVVADSSVRLLAFNRESFETIVGSLKEIVERRKDEKMLLDLPLLEKAPASKRDDLVRLFNLETFEIGTPLCACGDPNARFIVIKTGVASVWRPSPQLSSSLKEGDANTATQRGGAKVASSDTQPRSTGDSFDTYNSNNWPNSSSGSNTRVGSRAASQDGSSSLLRLNSKDMSEEKGESESEKKEDTPSGVNFSENLEECLALSAKGNDSGTARRKFMRSISRTESEISLASFDTGPKHQASLMEKTKSMNNFELATPNGNQFGRVFFGDPEGGDKHHTSSLFDDATAEMGPGEYVGDQCLMNHKPMDCTVIAKTQLKCFVLYLEDVVALSCCSHETVGKLKKKKSENKIWSTLFDLGCVGRGTFGTVHMAQSRLNNKVYAVKVINKERMRLMKYEKRLVSEKSILKNMDSAFICRYYSASSDDHCHYMLMEFLPGGELKSLVYPKDTAMRQVQREEVSQGNLAGIPHQPAKFYTAAISIPLIYLHRRNIVYRDLKLENIMIDRHGYPKLIDFGLAKNLSDCPAGRTYTLCGTPEYLAPEVILGLGHGTGVDYWTMGILLYEMVAGVTPFRGKEAKLDEMTVFENIVEHRLRFPEDMQEGCVDLIQRLLTKKPAMRLGGGRKKHKDFEEHGWFNGFVDWHALSLKQVRPPWVPSLNDPTDTSYFNKVSHSNVRHFDELDDEVTA